MRIAKTWKPSRVQYKMAKGTGERRYTVSTNELDLVPGSKRDHRKAQQPLTGCSAIDAPAKGSKAKPLCRHSAIFITNAGKQTTMTSLLITFIIPILSAQNLTAFSCNRWKASPTPFWGIQTVHLPNCIIGDKTIEVSTGIKTSKDKWRIRNSTASHCSKRTRNHCA